MMFNMKIVDKVKELYWGRRLNKVLKKNNVLKFHISPAEKAKEWEILKEVTRVVETHLSGKSLGKDIALKDIL